MSDDVPERDWRPFAGRELVKVLDSILDERLELDPTLTQLEAVAREVLKWPTRREDIKRAVFPEWTSVSSTIAHPTSQSRDHMPIPAALHHHAPYARQTFTHHLSQAVAVLSAALAGAQITLSGIREPGGPHGWTRESIPQGLLDTRRWRLYRQGSHLVPLNPEGGEDTPAFSAVRVASPAASAALPAEPAPPVSSRGGRPPDHDWGPDFQKEAAERLARPDSTLEGVARELLDLPYWPEPVPAISTVKTRLRALRSKPSETPLRTVSNG